MPNRHQPEYGLLWTQEEDDEEGSFLQKEKATGLFSSVA